jgi:hypothetical protein
MSAVPSVSEFEVTLFGVRDRAAELFGRLALAGEEELAVKAKLLFQRCSDALDVCSEIREIARRKEQEHWERQWAAVGRVSNG